MTDTTARASQPFPMKVTVHQDKTLGVLAREFANLTYDDVSNPFALSKVSINHISKIASFALKEDTKRDQTEQLVALFRKAGFDDIKIHESRSEEIVEVLGTDMASETSGGTTYHKDPAPHYSVTVDAQDKAKLMAALRKPEIMALVPAELAECCTAQISRKKQSG